MMLSATIAAHGSHADFLAGLSTPHRKLQLQPDLGLVLGVRGVEFRCLKDLICSVFLWVVVRVSSDLFSLLVGSGSCFKESASSVPFSTRFGAFRHTTL